MVSSSVQAVLVLPHRAVVVAAVATPIHTGFGTPLYSASQLFGVAAAAATTACVGCVVLGLGLMLAAGVKFELNLRGWTHRA